MGMSAEAQAHSAVEMVAHCNLFTRRFCVEVNDYDVCFLLKLRQDFINSIIWAISRLHKNSAYQGNYCNGRPFAGFIICNASASCLFGKIGRPGDMLAFFQRLYYILFAVSVVA